MTAHRAVVLCGSEGTVLGSYWYTIEKAEHGNVQTTVMDGPNHGFLYYSGRISDADVEGPAHEMLAIAEAIEQRRRVEFKRCAVDARVCVEDDLDGYEIVLFWSPRNSRMRGAVDLADAQRLAAQIRLDVPLPTPGVVKES